MRANRLGLIFGVAALAALPLLLPGSIARAAQNAQQSGGPPIRVEVNQVNLLATVRDKKTRQIVSNLEQSDFKVTEDNTEQKIVFFSRDSTLPITLAMLIDTSGSQQYTLGAEQEAAGRFLSRIMRKGDLSTVISFDSNADLLADFTDDVGVLQRAIRRARINAPVTLGPMPTDPAGTLFYDAVYLACHDKLASEAGRKAVIVLTDAEDQGSQMKLQEVIEAAQRSDTVVHILLIGDPGHYGIDERDARKLTDETGGRTILIRSEKNMESAFDELSEELRAQYTLGYYPSNAARDGSYRKIKVESTRKDVEILTRHGYYAPAE